jgi:transposase
VPSSISFATTISRKRQHYLCSTTLSLGWVTTIWLSAILSRGDRRLVHVEPWVSNRLWTLRTTTGHDVQCLDFTDDRLEIVPRCLHDDSRWGRGAVR